MYTYSISCTEIYIYIGVERRRANGLNYYIDVEYNIVVVLYYSYNRTTCSLGTGGCGNEFEQAKTTMMHYAH